MLATMAFLVWLSLWACVRLEMLMVHARAPVMSDLITARSLMLLLNAKTDGQLFVVYSFFYFLLRPSRLQYSFLSFMMLSLLASYSVEC